MSTKGTQPLKGFRDRYPEEKAFQEYLFKTVRSVAALYGFQEYDGPLVEPIELYEGKTSRELLEEQAFTLKDRNDKTLMLRPEMTPSLARMVAAKSQELTLPIRLFNIGLRYRYEAPQKGRDREFYQMDFDILGSDSQLAEIEILAVVVELYKRLGATPENIIVYINSRDIMNQVLHDYGINTDITKKVISIIDRKEKVSDDAFTDMLTDAGLTVEQISSVQNLLENPQKYENRFADILALAKEYGIDEFIQVNPTIVRGLDYYTGIVFEVKSRGTLTRSLFGGGRYDNLIGMFGTKDPIPGVGFATSDAVTRAFLEEADLMPELDINSSQVLVSIFSQETQNSSLQTVRQLRESGIASELYPAIAKLPKQFKYADRKGIPYVVVIGPEEAEKGLCTLRNMSSGKQEELSLEALVTKLS